MATFTIEYPTGSFPYIIGDDILGSYRTLTAIDGPVALVTDERTAEIHLARCEAADLVVVLPSGRNQKTLTAVQEIHRHLLDAKLDRSVTLVALGDSIVSDVTAFAAATYLRGVDVVHLPTELIAMIDTSVGGKVGLDVPHGRNLIGLFKQPAAVIADVTTLAMLTAQQFSAGMSEVVKHALIDGGELLTQIENKTWTPSTEQETLAGMVAQAVRIKMDVIGQDIYDEGRRQVLNLGHTFAYAYESATLGELSHGEAVGIGLISAAHLSNLIDLCPKELPLRIVEIITRVGGHSRLPRAVDYGAIDRAMSYDKKRKNSQQRFVLLEDAGRPIVLAVEDRAAVHSAVTAVQPS